MLAFIGWIAFIFLGIGLISPKIISKIVRRDVSRKTSTLVCIGILFLVGAIDFYKESKAPDPLAAKRKEVETRFKSGQEPTAKDALWTSNNIFKVGVLNNGTKRDGYAMYVCETLNDYGFKGKGVWVQVIDIQKLVISNEWVKLGECHCE